MGIFTSVFGLLLFGDFHFLKQIRICFYGLLPSVVTALGVSIFDANTSLSVEEFVEFLWKPILLITFLPNSVLLAFHGRYLLEWCLVSLIMQGFFYKFKKLFGKSFSSCSILWFRCAISIHIC